MDIVHKTAIVILAYSDFEALEISLYVHSHYLPKDIDIFILQNGRGTYDCERTYKVAKRYETLYPKQIKVIDWIKPQHPYSAIKELLNNSVMDKYEYICKMDDDTFPITEDWFENLCECYTESYSKYGEDLSYITGIVNNNSWGFIQVLDRMKLFDEYFDRYARDHYVGEPNGYNYGNDNLFRLVSKDKIEYGISSTIWRLPYLARWIHHKTTLNVDEYISKFRDKIYKEVDNSKRYSINCILFKKDFWNKIYDKNDKINCDDEHFCFTYSFNNNKKIIASFNVPLVHIAFFTQRDENKDLIPLIKDYYEKRLNLPYPISLCSNKIYENENRIRFIENNNMNNIKTNFILFGLLEDYKYYYFYFLGIKITIRKK